MVRANILAFFLILEGKMPGFHFIHDVGLHINVGFTHILHIHFKISSFTKLNFFFPHAPKGRAAPPKIATPRQLPCSTPELPLRGPNDRASRHLRDVTESGPQNVPTQCREQRLFFSKEP